MAHTVFQAPGDNASVLMLAKTRHVGWSLHGICFATSSLSICEYGLLLDWYGYGIVSDLVPDSWSQCQISISSAKYPVPYSVVALDALLHNGLSYVTAQWQTCFHVSISKLAVGAAPWQSWTKEGPLFTLRTKLFVLVPEHLLLRSWFASYTIIRESIAFRPCANDNMAIRSKYKKGYLSVRKGALHCIRRATAIPGERACFLLGLKNWNGGVSMGSSYSFLATARIWIRGLLSFIWRAHSHIYFDVFWGPCPQPEWGDDQRKRNDSL